METPQEQIAAFLKKSGISKEGDIQDFLDNGQPE